MDDIRYQCPLKHLYKGKLALVIKGVHIGQCVKMLETAYTLKDGKLINTKLLNRSVYNGKGDLFAFYDDELMGIELPKGAMMDRKFDDQR